jgi:GAF domain-containing protein
MDWEFVSGFAASARDMAEHSRVPTTLERAVDMCTQVLTPCDMAGVSVAVKDRVHTLVATSERLRAVDDLQFQLQEGPCFDSLRHEEAVTSNDLAKDDRWPHWGPLVSDQTGVHASLSYRLFTTERILGALNVYSQRPCAFDHDDVARGYVIAAHASAAVASSKKEAQLTEALESRTLIGQATGILMERFGLEADVAFGVLRRLSQTHNIKIVTLAADLVDHGRLPP